MKKVLIVVDFQKDFVDGSLGFDGAELLDERICKKIDAFRENNDDVIFTYDCHGENYLETNEGRHLPVEHCIKGSEGFELFGNVSDKKLPTDKIFEKKTFPSLELGNYLKDKDYDTVELCGLVSNICVISNAVIAKAALPEADIIVDATCTDGFDKEMSNKSFDVMESMQIKVVNR